MGHVAIKLNPRHLSNPDADVIETLRAKEICHNQILDSAVIGISTDATRFKIVHPPENDGEFTVDPW